MKPKIDLSELPENCPNCGARTIKRHFVYAIPESGVGVSGVYCPANGGREAAIRNAIEESGLALYYGGGLEGWKATGPNAPKSLRTPADYPTYVYYFYDRQGNLLYVGITDNIERRWAQHAAKPWWHMVARKEYVQYPTRTEAARVEAHQIRTQRPTFNRAMNGWNL